MTERLEPAYRQAGFQLLPYQGSSLPIELSHHLLRPQDSNLHLPAYETGLLPLQQTAILIFVGSKRIELLSPRS